MAISWNDYIQLPSKMLSFKAVLYTLPLMQAANGALLKRINVISIKYLSSNQCHCKQQKPCSKWYILISLMPMSFSSSCSWNNHSSLAALIQVCVCVCHAPLCLQQGFKEGLNQRKDCFQAGIRLKLGLWGSLFNSQ